MEILYDAFINKIANSYNFEIHMMVIVWLVTVLIVFILAIMTKPKMQEWIINILTNNMTKYKTFTEKIYSPHEIDCKFKDQKKILLILVTTLLQSLMIKDITRGYKTYHSSDLITEIRIPFKDLGGNSLTDDMFKTWDRLQNKTDKIEK